MATPQPAQKPERTRHRINEVPGRTTPAPGQPKPSGDDKSTKVNQMIALMRQPGGVSLETLVKITGWKDHSVRAFISRNLKKGRDLDVRLVRNATGPNTYQLAAEAVDQIEEAI